jgi:hypothetical protein
MIKHGRTKPSRLIPAEVYSWKQGKQKIDEQTRSNGQCCAHQQPSSTGPNTKLRQQAVSQQSQRLLSAASPMSWHRSATATFISIICC